MGEDAQVDLLLPDSLVATSEHQLPDQGTLLVKCVFVRGAGFFLDTHTL